MEKSVPIETLIEWPMIAVEKRTFSDPRMGKKNDMKAANPTAMAAIEPEKVTRKEDHPERKPVSFPYASLM
ncbi:MAG: hypothetical protein HYY47_08975 [Deltaproteobacteria bacterium]|nr:hypothetical protein [Deltaproteobacteria bacterium]